MTRDAPADVGPFGAHRFALRGHDERLGYVTHRETDGSKGQAGDSGKENPGPANTLKPSYYYCHRVGGRGHGGENEFARLIADRPSRLASRLIGERDVSLGNNGVRLVDDRTADAPRKRLCRCW